MPGLLAVVRRRRGIAEHVFEELLGAAWIAVRTFNPNRSPSSIAASLISDADYNAFRAAARRRSADEQPADLDFTRRADEREPSACEQLAELLVEAGEAGLAAADLELIRQLLAAPTTNQLAEELAVTPRTIRNRRRRITTELRAIALAA
jgi:DNA-directed RNA polymerase specialized sigma24 family protein